MKHVALITGASSGIGKELARLHASQGGDLVIVARREQALEELKQELESQHPVTVKCVASDLTEPDAPERLYDQEQLARLARVSTTVDCECPQHLAGLLRSLAARRREVARDVTLADLVS